MSPRPGRLTEMQKDNGAFQMATTSTRSESVESLPRPGRSRADQSAERLRTKSPRISGRSMLRPSGVAIATTLTSVPGEASGTTSGM